MPLVIAQALCLLLIEIRPLFQVKFLMVTGKNICHVHLQSVSFRFGIELMITDRNRAYKRRLSRRCSFKVPSIPSCGDFALTHHEGETDAYISSQRSSQGLYMDHFLMITG